MKKGMSLHELYIACSPETYENLIRVLARALELDEDEAESRLEEILARVVQVVAANPELLQALLNAGIPEGPAARDREPRGSNPEGGERS